jgi:hypothetical protein
MKNKEEISISSVMGGHDGIRDLCAALSRLESEWRSIVGESLGARSAPLSYGNDILVVAVDGAPALQDMNFKKNVIMREIRGRIRLAINDIKVRQGVVRGVNYGRVASDRRVRKRPAMPATDEGIVNSIVAELLSKHSDMDPEIARVIARCRAMCEH